MRERVTEKERERVTEKERVTERERESPGPGTAGPLFNKRGATPNDSLIQDRMSGLSLLPAAHQKLGQALSLHSAFNLNATKHLIN